MYSLESLDHKSNEWRFVHGSVELREVEHQFDLCVSMFPQATYRLVQVLKFAPRREDQDGKPIPHEARV